MIRNARCPICYTKDGIAREIQVMFNTDTFETFLECQKCHWAVSIEKIVPRGCIVANRDKI